MDAFFVHLHCRHFTVCCCDVLVHVHSLLPGAFELFLITLVLRSCVPYKRKALLHSQTTLAACSCPEPSPASPHQRLCKLNAALEPTTRFV